MILVIDTHDTFTYTLVQCLGELGAAPHVVRNHALDVEAAGALAPRASVLSPGPCTPREAGITVPVLQRRGAHIPMLGVCPGHQAIGEAFRGRVVRTRRIMHGRTSGVAHDGTGRFARLPRPLEVMRDHSLVIERASLPAEREGIARAAADATGIHAVRHRVPPVRGGPFHPEAAPMQGGRRLLANVLALADASTADGRAA